MTIISFHKRIHKARFRQKIPKKRFGMKTKSYIPRRIVRINKGRISIFKIRTPRIKLFKWKPKDPLQYFRSFSSFYTLPSHRIRDIQIQKKKKSFNAKKSFKPKALKKTYKRKYKKFIRDKSMDHIFKGENWKKAAKEWKRQSTFLYPWRKNKYLTNLSEYVGKPKWGGPRDMSGRKYTNYGPYPKPLGPKLVFDIVPTRELLTAFKLISIYGTAMTKRIKKRTKDVIKDVRSKLLKYAKVVIDRYVPKETGELQDSMTDSLLKSKVMGWRLKIEMEADVPWAGVANRMPEKKIRHPKKDARGRSIIQIGRRSRKILYDPYAQKGSYNLILMLLKKKAKKLIYDMITKLIQIWTISKMTGIYKPPPTRKKYIKVHSQPSGHFIRVKEVVRNRAWTSYYNRDVPRIYPGGHYTVPDPMSLREKHELREVRRRQQQTRKYRKGKQVSVAPSRKIIKSFFRVKGLLKTTIKR